MTRPFMLAVAALLAATAPVIAATPAPMLHPKPAAHKTSAPKSVTLKTADVTDVKVGTAALPARSDRGRALRRHVSRRQEVRQLARPQRAVRVSARQRTR